MSTNTFATRSFSAEQERSTSRQRPQTGDREPCSSLHARAGIQSREEFRSIWASCKARQNEASSKASRSAPHAPRPNLPLPAEIRDIVWRVLIEHGVKQSSIIDSQNTQRENAIRSAMATPILFVNSAVRRECLPLRTKYLNRHLGFYVRLMKVIPRPTEKPFLQLKHVTIRWVVASYNMNHKLIKDAFPKLKSLTLYDANTSYFQQIDQSLKPDFARSDVNLAVHRQERTLCRFQKDSEMIRLLDAVCTNVMTSSHWFLLDLGFPVFWRMRCNPFWDVVIDVNDIDDLTLVRNFKTQSNEPSDNVSSCPRIAARS